MGRGLVAWLLLLLIVASFGGSLAWSQEASWTIYIEGVDEPGSVYAFHLLPWLARRVVVRDSRLAGLYVEVSNTSGGADTYVIEVVNSSLDYIVVASDTGMAALRLVTVRVNDSVIETVTVMASRFEARGLTSRILNVTVAEGLVEDSNVDAVEIYVIRSVRVSGLAVGSLLIHDATFIGSTVELHNVSLKCTGPPGGSQRVVLEGSGGTNIWVYDSRLSCLNRSVMVEIAGFRNAGVYKSRLGSIQGYTLFRGAGGAHGSALTISRSTVSGNLRVEAGWIRVLGSRIGEYWPNGTVVRTIRGLQTAVYLLLFETLLLSGSGITASAVTASGSSGLVRNSTITAERADFFIRDSLTILKARLLTQAVTMGFSFRTLRLVDSVIAGNVYVKSNRRGQSVDVRFIGVKFTHASKLAAVSTGGGTRLLSVELYNSTIVNPGWVLSAYSDPFEPARIRLSTGSVYWASPLGPTVRVMGRVERRGGATLSIVSPKASLNLESWLATPLGPMIKPCTPAEGMEAGPGRYVYGMIEWRCALILDTGRLATRIWVYSTAPLRIEVHGLGGLLANATVQGNATIDLSAPSKTFFIYFKELPAPPRTTENTTSTTTHTTAPTREEPMHNSSTTGQAGSGRTQSPPQAPPLIAAAAVILAIIGYYLYTINKRSHLQ